MAVPNIFGTATAAIPLSQLDQNFATAITLGNTAVYLGNTTTSLGNVTLTNVTISSGTSNIAANVSTAVGLLPEAQGGTGTTTGYYGFKNRLINSAMVIDQRNAGAASANTINGYFLDRWQVLQTAITGKIVAQQNAGSLSAANRPAGFTNYLGITSQSAYSITSSDNFSILQQIEGFNVADFGWGTANAQTATLSFWVRSSLTGTFGGAFSNAGVTRSYPFSYTISAANTWELKTVIVAGDTSGTWATDNTSGIRVWFGLGAGSTYSGTAGAWAAADYRSATGATSVVGTNGATFYITGVQLEKGSTATSFDYRPYGTELALCQRYYFKLGDSSYSTYASGYGENGTSATFQITYPVQMRATPTLVLSGTNRLIPVASLSNNTIAYSQLSKSCGYFGVAITSGTTGFAYLIGANDDATANLNGSAEL